MNPSLILASSSEIRMKMLVQAGLRCTAAPSRVDEDAIRAAMLAEGAGPRDVADSLAEAKARKVSDKNPSALVIGCDQVLAFEDEILNKPHSNADALAQLHRLRGKTHHLYSAAVIYMGGQPLWRHVGHARMTMRDLSDAMLADYTARNWDSIRHSVGGYKIEEEGVQLFAAIDGDTFTIQGLPLLPLLHYLAVRGVIAS